jgi:hypothetical protein
VPLLMEDHKKIIAAEDSRLTPSQKAQGYGFNPRFPRMDPALPGLELHSTSSTSASSRARPTESYRCASS